MNYSYKEHEFWLFFVRSDRNFRTVFRKYHDVFAKTSLRYKKHVFYLFSARTITVFGVESESVKGMFFRSLFSFVFQICLKKRDIFRALIFCIVKGIKKESG